MVDGLHILICNRKKKPLAMASSGVGTGLRGKDNVGNVTNVQYKSNWNCHMNAPLYDEYILINNVHCAHLWNYHNAISSCC
jgi:hypothetical protein